MPNFDKENAMRRMMTTLAVLLTACGSSTEPDGRVPQLGRYAYEAPVIGTGTLTITHATRDSIAATWDVSNSTTSGMRGRAGMGTWNVDAYVLYGTRVSRVATAAGGRDSLTFTETYAHRIWRQGQGMACTVKPIPGATTGCTLRYLGP
jgi:hypothetical protein